MDPMAPFELLRPRSLAEATALLAATPGARPLAGGTDLVPNLRHGLGTPPALVDLSGIAEMNTLHVAAGGVTLGAGVTLAGVAASVELGRALPALVAAALAVAGPAHRTAATVGGNLCVDTRCVFFNQSGWWRRANDHCLKHGGDVCHVAPQGRRCHAAFSGDLAPVLLVLGADVLIAGGAGVRRVPLAALYADDGAAHLTLQSGEIVCAVHVPQQPDAAPSGYRKARIRGAIDFPLAGVAARIIVHDCRMTELRVALTGTNVRPFLLDGVDVLCGRPIDDEFLGALAKLVSRQAGPMRTTAMPSNYRRQVAAALAKRLVRELATGNACHGIATASPP